jgi:hypothetical protein
VQDWQTVFHAGANKLNNCVWTPTFSLLLINPLLQIVNEHTLMANRDMEEMFLNFNLHPDTMKYPCIDIRLMFTPKEYPNRWMCWTCNLMGFKASPYNLVRMCLIAKEIIQGDQNDKCNAFHWTHFRLNLPGTRNYKPAHAWVSKQQQDKLLASNFVCFVDDQQVTAASSQCIIKAGHAISTQESYLGLHDALCKIRAPHGLQCPGAWAGTNMCIKEGLGVVVLMSQEKWDQMKAICVHWLEVLRQDEKNLEYKKLLSD